MNSEALYEMSVRVTRRAESAQRVAARAEMVSRVVARMEIRRVASQVCSEVFPGKTASSDSTREILVAMAEGALISDEGSVRVAGLGSLITKMKEIASAIKANPNVWDHLKKLIGIESLDQLPGKLKELVLQMVLTGNATLESTAGAGTTVALTLPKGAPSALRPDAAEGGQPAKILSLIRREAAD